MAERAPDGVTDADARLAEQRDRVWLLLLRGALLRARTAEVLRRHRWELMAFRRRLQELRAVRGIVPNPRPLARRSRRRTPQAWVRLVRPRAR